MSEEVYPRLFHYGSSLHTEEDHTAPYDKALENEANNVREVLANQQIP